MNDGSGGYDRLIEKNLNDIRADVTKVEDRVQNLELWRSTILGGLAALLFAAGAGARDVVAWLKHLTG